MTESRRPSPSQNPSAASSVASSVTPASGSSVASTDASSTVASAASSAGSRDAAPSGATSPSPDASAPPARPYGIQTVDELLEAARRHGLEIVTRPSAFEETGLDFRVVHGEDEHGRSWIVRTPRRSEVLESARVEAKILELVAGRVPVAVPEWRVFSDDVIAYPRVEGTPAVTLDPERGPTWNILDPAAPNEAFLDSYARFFAALQSIDLEEAKVHGVPVRSIDEAREQLRDAMTVSRAVLQPSEAVWSRWQRWLDADALWPQHLALVHGDLHPGHMLLGPDGSLAGVLDWTEAQVTDPSVDLAMFFGCFGGAVLDALLERVARAGGRTWPGLAAHAAERWAAFPALLAAWGTRNGNDAVVEHARGQLAAIAG